MNWYEDDIKAIAEALEVEDTDTLGEILENYEHGEPLTIDLEHGEWILCNEETAQRLAEEYVEETLWAFRPSWLAGVTGLDESIFTLLAETGKCEDLNPVVTALIKGTGVDGDQRLAHVIWEAVNYDGRGHFLSSYDGEEIELEAEIGTLYVYRTN